MNKEQILGIVRHILTFAGGFLVTKGLADVEVSSELVGAVITIVGAVWSIIQKKKVS